MTLRRLSLALLVFGHLVATACGAPQTPAPLVTAIKTAREAIESWNFTAMTNSAAQLENVASADAAAAGQRDYWRGIVLMHAVFYSRESTQDSVIRALEASLRQEAITALQNATAQEENSAVAHAALAVLLGMSIDAGGWLNAMRLGPSFLRHQKAAKQAPPNPQVEYLFGVSALRRARTQRHFASARDQLRRAVDLFETEQQTAPPSSPPLWGYDLALDFLGDACAQLGDQEQAALWHAKARRSNPSLRRTHKENP